MFDIAFSELLLIAVVALIVIGPEKLPKVARTLGLLAGRLQRYVANVKSDIDRELQFQDLQKLQQEIKQSTERLQADARLMQTHVSDQVKEVENSIRAPTALENTDLQAISEATLAAQPVIEQSDPPKPGSKQPGPEKQ